MKIKKVLFAATALAVALSTSVVSFAAQDSITYKAKGYTINASIMTDGNWKVVSSLSSDTACEMSIQGTVLDINSETYTISAYAGRDNNIFSTVNTEDYVSYAIATFTANGVSKVLSIGHPNY